MKIPMPCPYRHLVHTYTANNPDTLQPLIPTLILNLKQIPLQKCNHSYSDTYTEPYEGTNTDIYTTDNYTDPIQTVIQTPMQTLIQPPTYSDTNTYTYADFTDT